MDAGPRVEGRLANQPISLVAIWSFRGAQGDTASRATMAYQLRALHLGVIALPAGNRGLSGSGDPQRGWM